MFSPEMCYYREVHVAVLYYLHKLLLTKYPQKSWIYTRNALKLTLHVFLWSSAALHFMHFVMNHTHTQAHTQVLPETWRPLPLLSATHPDIHKWPPVVTTLNDFLYNFYIINLILNTVIYILPSNIANTLLLSSDDLFNLNLCKFSDSWQNLFCFTAV